MKVFASDSNNDLFIANDGNLAIRQDIDAVMQAAQQSAQAQLGEMVYAVDEGVPNFQTVWRSSTNIAQFEAFLRRAILKVEGVSKIESLDVVVRDSALFYTAEILTIYGRGSIQNA